MHSDRTGPAVLPRKSWAFHQATRGKMLACNRVLLRMLASCSAEEMFCFRLVFVRLTAQ
jgi:hypothetical protein